ncbi:MAG: hypothetical protein WKF50_13155 [Nocardioides sp.]
MNRHHHVNNPDHEPDGTALAYCARQAEDPLRRLAHLTITGPDLTPAQIDTVMSPLAETVATLPQVAQPLGRILDRSRETHHLAIDAMTATSDPDLAIDTARLHLEALRGSAFETYRHLNAARNEAAHISAKPLSEPKRADRPDRPIALSADLSRHQRLENRHPSGPHGPDPHGPDLRGPAR